MAILWCRLWNDMPTDPKWRVIAKRSGQPLCTVIAVYVAMLTNANASKDRGVLEKWDDEDMAIALDLETEQVASIREQMQGKVLDGNQLTGWEKRQPRPVLRPSAEKWKKIRNRIFKRDNYTCSYCGKRGTRLECDHIIPVSRGGSHDDDNLTTSCFTCNRSKFNRTPQEWGFNQ